MGYSKKRLIVGVLFLLVMMVLPSVGLAGSQDFTLVNNSSYSIVGFWVAPANSDNWEENLMAGSALEAGDSIDISFDNSGNIQWWNFRVKDGSGHVWTWEKNDYDLTQISQITYYYNNSGKGAINYK
ncbi:hypothetical protein SPSIL_040810 [Sporomusa silvacetica DSM 10669]|uniref:Uncharacterized protein n=1 Tax=Sporomusa silvacetica DSM 10669 TaxID=1123289 RepID=A0ABZ3IQ52_9FIRM|nr:hypothetical protein [Sporomusa silvacetica]OZC23407.1 hypothetical protein SPSIL_02480 [Sporomusa silvacetica DSM 10669]